MKTLEAPLTDPPAEDPPAATTEVLQSLNAETSAIDPRPPDYQQAYAAGYASVSRLCTVEQADAAASVANDTQLATFFEKRTSGVKHFLGALGIGNERYKFRRLASRRKPNFDILLAPEVLLDFTTIKYNAADATRLLYVLSDD